MDSVIVERLFRSLKTELIYIEEFNSLRELRSGISGYVPRYNAIRPHEALNYQAPEQIYSAAFSGEWTADLDCEGRPFDPLAAKGIRVRN